MVIFPLLAASEETFEAPQHTLIYPQTLAISPHQGPTHA